MAQEKIPNYQDFETLLEKHNREIFVYLWRMLPTPEDAEDCLQDTFLKAYKAFPRLKNHDHLRAWLYKIATNTANTHFKKNRDNTIEITENLPNSNPSIPSQIESKLLLEEVRSAVEILPKKQRAALMLSKCQHLKYPEIAKVLNISEDSARANVYQALKKLRSQFKNRIEAYD